MDGSAPFSQNRSGGLSVNFQTPARLTDGWVRPAVTSGTGTIVGRGQRRCPVESPDGGIPAIPGESSAERSVVAQIELTNVRRFIFSDTDAGDATFKIRDQLYWSQPAIEVDILQDVQRGSHRPGVGLGVCNPHL